MKQFKISICPSGKKVIVPEGTTLLEALSLSGERPDAPCGGRGMCGKCRVTVYEGKDRKICHACKTAVDRDMLVELSGRDDKAKILTAGQERKVRVSPRLGFMEGETPKSGRWCLAAFDIGTTTIAGYLLDGRTGEVLACENCMNSQIQFGADVVSRAVRAVEEGTGRLTECMRKDLNGLLNNMTEK